jgi:2'-5' RNA ligase
MIRAFIAITPSMALRQSARDVGAALQRLAPSWRWVDPEQIHLTLKFLGDVPAEALPAIGQAVEHAVAGQAPFTLLARTLGCFPHPSRPRVLWMGLEDPQQALAHLQQRLESALTPLGFPPETRPLHPHLTLARAQQMRGRGQLLPLLQSYQHRVFGELAVAEIQLFQSHLRRAGAVYTVLHSVTLRG